MGMAQWEWPNGNGPMEMAQWKWMASGWRSPRKQRNASALHGGRPYGGDVLRVRPAPENGRARHQHVGAGARAVACVFGSDAAVDLQVDGPPSNHGPHPPDLLQHRRNEFLPAESRIDAHHQNQVEAVEHIHKLALRGVRGDRDAGFLAGGADELQRAVEMRTCLGMHGDDVGASLRESFDVRVDWCDHQVHVERLLGVRADGLHDTRPDRDVGYEVTIHNVHVHPVASRLVNGAHLLAELCEVRR